MKEKLMLITSIGLISINCYGGFTGWTSASRANCINNESITWYSKDSANLKTVSIHNFVKNNKWNHIVDSGWENTWRSAAVHWAEAADVGKYDWDVFGYFFWADWGNGKFPFKEDYTRDCHLYDGWWD